MDKTNPTIAQRVGQAAGAFEQRRTGRLPHSVSVALIDSTVVITLHGALSPAEKAMAQSPEAAAQMQELYRQVFASSCEALRQEIMSITGVAVKEASADVQTMNGAVLQVSATGTVVQVFQLSQSVPAESWSGSVHGDRS